MFDWRDPPGKSEWPNGDWEAAQGGHPRQEGGEGTAQETHAAEASADFKPVLAVCNPNPILQSGVLDSMGAISRLCHFAQRCDSDGLPPLGYASGEDHGIGRTRTRVPIRRHVSVGHLPSPAAAGLSFWPWDS